MSGSQLFARRVSHFGAGLLPRRQTNVLFHQTGIHTWTEEAQRYDHCGATTTAVTDRREAGNRHGSLQAVLPVYL